MTTKIEWADLTINPVIGCQKKSAGCLNCYAEKMAWRLAHNPKLPEHIRKAYQGVTENGKWNGKQVMVQGGLEKIKAFKGHKRVFVGSMTDLLLHRAARRCYIKNEPAYFHCITSVISHEHDHDFLILTKRPENIPEWEYSANLWIGATVESQEYAETRITALIKNVKNGNIFLSVEPMLSEINIPAELLGKLRWVVCGAETGAKARPVFPVWVMQLRDDCASAGVPFFFKKWNIKGMADGEIDGMVCREFPKEMERRKTG